MGALEDELRRLVAEDGTLVVVLDDDPTGVQSVHGVPVLTRWEREDFAWALAQPVSTVFVLTNSRAVPERRAVEMTREVALRALEAGEEAGRPVALVSRGDSTLRGHFPAEADALADVVEQQTGAPVDGVVLCPAFFEAGRFTRDDVHYVRDGGAAVPVGETPFAADAAFGFRASNLRDWVEEKTGGRWSREQVASIALEDLRSGSADRVAQALAAVDGGRPVVVNAESYADLSAFGVGLLRAERAGKRFIYRAGPSFARVRGGITPPPRLDARRLAGARGRARHGLVVVGSHVPQTTRQLAEAARLDGVASVELSVPRLLVEGQRDEEVARAAAAARERLGTSEVIVYTSREVVPADGRRNALDVAAAVSDALVDVVRAIDARELAWLIAKGGITSSDIGTRGLGVRRATVAGPLLDPGIVPVWVLPDDSAAPGLPYVIFPGNVGGPHALAQAIALLREDKVR